MRPDEPCYESLEANNGHRPPEIHTIVVWDVRNVELVESKLPELMPESLEVIDRRTVAFSRKPAIRFEESVYLTHKKKMVDRQIYLIVIRDRNPVYIHQRATKALQVMNGHMYTLKTGLREAFPKGGDIYHTIHGSYNPEEAMLVLRPLKLMSFVPRPKFGSLRELFGQLNSHPTLKYVVHRGADSIFDPMVIKHGRRDIDCLTDDYYLFKSLTGAVTKDWRHMRARDNDYYIQATVSVNQVEVEVDVRYIGDRFFDHRWEKEMLDRRRLDRIKDVELYRPSIEDEMQNLLYNLLIHKHGDSKTAKYNDLLATHWPNPAHRVAKVTVWLFKNRLVGVRFDYSGFDRRYGRVQGEPISLDFDREITDFAISSNRDRTQLRGLRLNGSWLGSSNGELHCVEVPKGQRVIGLFSSDGRILDRPQLEAQNPTEAIKQRTALWSILTPYLVDHGYRIPRPKDIRVKYYVDPGLEHLR